MVPSLLDEEKRNKEAQALKQSVKVPTSVANNYDVSFDSSVSKDRQQAFLAPQGPTSRPTPVARVQPATTEIRQAPTLAQPAVPDYGSMGVAERRFARQQFQDSMQALDVQAKMRGQDIAAKTTERGQDITAATAQGAQAVDARGQDLSFDLGQEANRNRATANAQAFSLGNERNAIDRMTAETNKSLVEANIKQTHAATKAAEQGFDRNMAKENARRAYIESLAAGNAEAAMLAKQALDSYDNAPAPPEKNKNKTGTVKGDSFVYSVAPDGSITFGAPPAGPQALGPRVVVPEDLTPEEWLAKQNEEDEEE